MGFRQDATTAASYADDTSGNPDTDAADAELYGNAATGEEQTADASAESGEYGDSVGEPEDTPTDDAPADDTAADDAPVDDTPVDDTPVDDSTADDDSSGT